MKLSDFSFHLPEHLIAQHPPEVRGQSRLLNCSAELQDLVFSDFASLLGPDDCLVLNNTRVINARLFGQKRTGGKVEVMIERVIDERNVVAMIRSSKSPKTGSQILLPAHTELTVTGRDGQMFMLRVDQSDVDLDTLLQEHGQMPLPPYITHEATEEDRNRYQTVFAEKPGAVAAPTAGLHFTEATLKAVKDKGAQIAHVTLHVGAGTFLPVKVDDISQHQMHRERYEIPADTVAALVNCKKKGGNVVAVGTTSMRSLEAWASETGINLNDPSSYEKAQQFGKNGHRGDTDIFITPGYEFKVVDRLLTNFHLPQSTLLMLVSAFAGKDKIDEAYQHAINREYRFFSYGDAMWLTKANQKNLVQTG